MKHARYIGEIQRLMGEGALVIFDEADEVLAQFDRMSPGDGGCGISLNGVDLAHGWHKFSKADFKLDEEN